LNADYQRTCSKSKIIRRGDDSDNDGEARGEDTDLKEVNWKEMSWPRSREK
jgi:hypothetical protein